MGPRWDAAAWLNAGAEPRQWAWMGLGGHGGGEWDAAGLDGVDGTRRG